MTDTTPTSAVLTEERLHPIEARRTAAQEIVSDLCNGRRRWEMHVPARPTEDPDLVISAALRDIPALIASHRILAQEVERLTKERDDILNMIEPYRKQGEFGGMARYPLPADADEADRIANSICNGICGLFAGTDAEYRSGIEYRMAGYIRVATRRTEASEARASALEERVAALESELQDAHGAHEGACRQLVEAEMRIATLEAIAALSPQPSPQSDSQGDTLAGELARALDRMLFNFGRPRSHEYMNAIAWAKALEDYDDAERVFAKAKAAGLLATPADGERV